MSVDAKEDNLNDTLRIVSSIIHACEKQQPKFQKGTPQHSLLENRLKALHIAKSLIAGENTIDNYVNEDLKEAIAPLSSIISKCEKAKMKLTEGSSHYTRLMKVLKAMYFAKSIISDEINRRTSP